MYGCPTADRRRPTRPTTQNKSSITSASKQLKQSRIKAAGNTNYKILTRLYLGKDVLYRSFFTHPAKTLTEDFINRWWIVLRSLIEYPFNTVLWNVEVSRAPTAYPFGKKIRCNATMWRLLEIFMNRSLFNWRSLRRIINQVQCFVRQTKQWLLIYDAGNVERISLLTLVCMPDFHSRCTSAFEEEKIFYDLCI